MSLSSLSSLLTAAAVHRICVTDALAMLAAYQATPESPATLGNIASSIGVTTASITHTADKLERLKFARRVRAANDRRVIHLTITPAGAAVINTLANHAA